MRKISFFLLFLSTSTFGQTAQTIDFNHFKSDLLGRLIFEKINKIRRKKKLPVLSIDEKLVQAAENQSEFLKKKGKLSHEQPKKKWKNPFVRARYYGSTSDLIEENVAFVTGGEFLNEDGKESFLPGTYEQAADELVESWIKSPGHYRNLTNLSVSKTGIAVSADSDKKTIYAVQVFGN